MANKIDAEPCDGGCRITRLVSTDRDIAVPDSVAQAYEIAVAKPSRRQAISRFAEQRKVYYLDFAAFIENTFPEVLTISDIRRAHCEAYVVSLVEHGRFVKSVSYSVRQKRGVKEVSYHRDSRWWKRRIGRKRAIQS